jgi:mono/diheme cytochrome c family protein
MMVKPEVSIHMIRFLLGVVIGVLLLPAAVWVWLHHGHPPVAVADSPLPFERQITGFALNARIDKEAPANAPVQANEATFVAGAKIYREQCAFCHGVSGIPSQVGQHMFPDAPPLWERHHNGAVVGVSDDPPGETYWKVANGIRLTGMPGYKEVLSDTEMWQVSMLLANADKPLPPSVVEVLKTPLNFDVPVQGPISVTTVGKPAPPAPAPATAN